MDATEARTTILGSPDADPTRRSKVLIGAPVFQSVYPEPFEAFLAMMVGCGRMTQTDFYVKVIARTPIHDAMNTLFHHGLTNGMDAIVWFDDDCGMPVDAVPRLLKHLGQGVAFIAGIGFMRNFPHTTTVGRWYPEGLSIEQNERQGYDLRGFQWLDDYSQLPRPIAEVDFCGFPIAAIRTDALLKLVYPWFHVRDDDGGGCTHDVFFASRLKRAGIPVLVDTTLECRHLSPAGWMDFQTREWARRFTKATETVEGVERLKAQVFGAVA